ncbi:MAG: glutamine amidotransferase [Candidatus Uhrbacteria bacterium]|nr:glutamine amidotransferase [Candidatus Uhrbacteria bacterium]
MKPILLLQIRPEDPASNGEYEAILKFGGLSVNDVHRVRVEQVGVPEVNFHDYSAIIVGGGPWNPGDPDEKKTDVQKQSEEKLIPLMRAIVDKDIPCFAICYGLEILTKALDVEITHDFHEKPGAVDLAMTEEGVLDPLLAGLPREFRAMVGHKEAAARVPDGGTLLLSSKDCPPHMFRMGHNVYAMQFHPELDVEGMLVRIEVYKHLGYFPLEQAEQVKEEVRRENITVPMEILKRFVDRYHT